jgi:hypothetical protein
LQSAGDVVEAVFAVSVLEKLPRDGHRVELGGQQVAGVLEVRETSARPEAERVREPLKMRSSRWSERRALILCSPITQRMASTMLLLPQPLGPTIR